MAHVLRRPGRPRTAPAPSAGPSAHVRDRRHRSVARRQQNTAADLLVAPFFVIFLAMLVAPLAYAGYLSFFQERLIGGVTFVGIDNYTRALSDPNFLSGVGRMVWFLVIQVPIMIGLALLFALVLDSGLLRLQRLVRLGIFIPYAVPGVVAALMWGYLYGENFGPFAQIGRGLGLGAPPFLSQDWMLASIMNIVTWEFVGYNMIIMFAALRSIPTELYEAARVDGAGEARIARSVKVPAILPAILLTVIFSVIGTFQLFNEPHLLRSLAPTVIGTSYTPNLYAYNLAFIAQDLNYAAAIAFLLGFVIMIVSYVVQLTVQRKGNQS